jgi:nitrilase
MFKAAVAQIGTVLFDTAATLARIESQCREAAAQGAALLLLPEAILGGYPKGLSFGATLGDRSPAGRELFRRYFDAAIDCPGPETEALAALAAELNLHIVLGIVERELGTLYCTSLLFTPQRGLTTRHRKLMPTGLERLLWGLGDGSTMQVTDTDLGRIGMAICWENYMPMFRQHLYNQGVQLWCAPTVDARDVWQSTLRHIAVEGRCFVLSACQRLTQDDWPDDLRATAQTIDGRSLIVSPFGDLLAGPDSAPSLLVTTIDQDEIARGKFDLDVAGHYSRPDIFHLSTRSEPSIQLEPLPQPPS